MPGPRKLPLVAICGRPNVGKSTLFNRISGRQSAIVHSDEGITRDRAYDEAEWQGRAFRIVDTGGIVESPTDPVTHQMQVQVRAALNEADVIVFVVDGRQEITRTDEEVRDALFKYSKPILLAVNKLDNPSLEMNRFDFFSLGLGEPYPISSTHGAGVADLLDALVTCLPEHAQGPAEEPERHVTKVAVIGKPNVGKSSFVNAVLAEDRVIVDSEPGTTRDALDVEMHWQGKEYLLIDTAGMRRKAGIKKQVERFSVSRSLRAVRRADVCLVLIDATEGLTEQDKRIASYVTKNGRAMVLVWTKWDLVDEPDKRFKEIASEIDLKAPFLKYVPCVTISNTTHKRLFTTFEYLDRVAAQASKRVTTGQLNQFMEEIRGYDAHATHKGRQAKVLYATQVSVKPTVFVLFVNQKKLFHFSYLRFIENKLRERYGFEGVPIQIELREGKPRP